MRCIKLLTEDSQETLNQYFTCRRYRIDREDGREGLLCYIGKDNESMESFCMALSDYIWTHIINKFLYFYAGKNILLTRSEARETADRALSVAMSIKDGCDVIKEKLEEFFLQGNKFISLEGFTRFRLKDLKKDLCALADLCIDELIAKREYEDFIALLKSFVDLQRPSGDPVCLRVERDGSHSLLDCNGKEILTREERSAGIAPDDLILSALVSCSPGKIFLYNEKASSNPQLLDTIKSIFAGRVFSVSEASSSPALPGFLQ